MSPEEGNAARAGPCDERTPSSGICGVQVWRSEEDANQMLESFPRPLQAMAKLLKALVKLNDVVVAKVGPSEEERSSGNFRSGVQL